MPNKYKKVNNKSSLTSRVKSALRSLFKSKKTKKPSTKPSSKSSKPNKSNKSKRSSSKFSKSRKSYKKMKGGSCDEYAFVNEQSMNIPELNGVPGLNISAQRASIGKVKTCPTVNHP
jgi:hypothetical protein